MRLFGSIAALAMVTMLTVASLPDDDGTQEATPTVVADSGGDYIEQQAQCSETQAVSNWLTSQGWNQSEFRFAEFDLSAAQERGNGSFTNHTLATREDLKAYLNGDTPSSVTAREWALSNLPETEHDRFMSGVGHVQVQLDQPADLTGNNLLQNGQVFTPNGVRSVETGDILWVYVDTHCEVHNEALIRADCGNGGITTVTPNRPEEPTPTTDTPPTDTPPDDQPVCPRNPELPPDHPDCPEPEGERCPINDQLSVDDPACTVQAPTGSITVDCDGNPIGGPTIEGEYTTVEFFEGVLTIYYTDVDMSKKSVSGTVIRPTAEDCQEQPKCDGEGGARNPDGSDACGTPNEGPEQQPVEDPGPTLDGDGNPVSEPDPSPVHPVDPGGEPPDPNEGGYDSGSPEPGEGTPEGQSGNGETTETNDPPSTPPEDTGEGGTNNAPVVPDEEDVCDVNPEFPGC